MPLLKAEPNQFPGDLLANSVACAATAIDGGGDPWWAAHTRSQQEKLLMRKLRTRDVAYYCPIAPRQYRSPSGRTRVSHLPLFSNYVFFRGDETARYQAMTTGCVATCLPVNDPSRLVRQLFGLQQAIDADIGLTPESKLVVGTPVRIRSGSFAGVEGTIFERQGRTRLLLAVDFLQQGASLEVHDWDVEPV